MFKLRPHLINSCFLLGLGMLASNAEARMYQWINPDTGTTQLSGKPPAWYRGESTGPRILVIENGQIIDDTQLQVSSEQSVRLRQHAFRMASEQDKEQRLEAQRLRAVLDRTTTEEEITKSTQATLVEALNTLEPESEEQSDITDSAATSSETVISEDVLQAEGEDPAIEAMKAVIEDWEKQRTEEAQRVLKKKQQ